MYNRYLFPNYYDYVKSSAVKNFATSKEARADKKFTFPENLSNALNLIQKAVAGESEDRAFYSYLIDNAPDEEEKQIITEIRDNEISHYSLFQQIYYEITGEMVPKQNQEEFTPPATYCEGLKRSLLGEQNAVKNYRQIFYALQTRDHINMITEIITDEIRHGILYSYLYSKNGCSA
jgi:rubrerythrin